jgi:hypothetical protein
MTPLRLFFPPIWTIGQKWKVEYIIDRKIIPIGGDATTVMAENTIESRQVWDYLVKGEEVINGRPHIVVSATPDEKVGDEFTIEEYQLLIDKETMTLHATRIHRTNFIGSQDVEYLKNPWPMDSFFMNTHEHMILDWPLIDQDSKDIGVGIVAFQQKTIVDNSGLSIAFAGSQSETVLVFAKDQPWWIAAEKKVQLPDRIIRMRARMIAGIIGQPTVGMPKPEEQPPQPE